MAREDILNNAETANPGYFDEASEMEKRGSFSRREVGLTHPDTSSFIKLSDKGDIEIFANEELGIVISPSTGTISIFADIFKIYTKEDAGFRWNNKSFNHAGDSYHEPSLVDTDIKEINPGYNYADYYLNIINEIDQIDNSSNNIITINSNSAFKTNSDQVINGGIPINPESGISVEISNLLKEYALTHSQDKVDYMQSLVKSGFTFDQAREKTMRDKGV